MTDRPPSERLRQGLVLLAGTVVFVLLVGAGPANFYYTPLGLGLIYLAAAIAGGRRGGYWATACVLVGWGAAVLLARRGHTGLDPSGLYLAGAGLGATAGVLLARAGFAVDALGVAVSVLLAGAILAVEGQWSSVLGDARTYALLVGAVALFNVAAGSRQAAVARA